MAISGWGVFLIILLVLIVIGAISYVGYIYYRARRLGLPPPSLNPFSSRRSTSTSYRAPAPAPGGIRGWISSTLSSLRGRDRTTTGAYESNSHSYGGSSLGGGGRGGGRHGFGPLDPDEAWDSRVDQEVYDEGQELADDVGGSGPYGGDGYGRGVGGVGGIDGRGRSRDRERQREVDRRYDEVMHGNVAGRDDASSRVNPFGDHAETESLGLRSVSPRPDGGSYGGGQGHKKQGSNLSVGGHEGDSPVERRSLFREDV